MYICDSTCIDQRWGKWTTNCANLSVVKSDYLGENPVYKSSRGDDDEIWQWFDRDAEG